MNKRTNITRGFMKLRVWQEAKDLYVLAYPVYQKFPLDLKRVAANQIAAVDSVHRNIAEGYGRKSKREYLRYLEIALASLLEFTSGNYVYLEAKQLTELEFEHLDMNSYKLENGLRKLIESIQRKTDEWNDSLSLEEPKSLYKIKKKWQEWNEITIVEPENQE